MPHRHIALITFHHHYPAIYLVYLCKRRQSWSNAKLKPILTVTSRFIIITPPSTSSTCVNHVSLDQMQNLSPSSPSHRAYPRLPSSLLCQPVCHNIQISSKHRTIFAHWRYAGRRSNPTSQQPRWPCTNVLSVVIPRQVLNLTWISRRWLRTPYSTPRCQFHEVEQYIDILTFKGAALAMQANTTAATMKDFIVGCVEDWYMLMWGNRSWLFE